MKTLYYLIIIFGGLSLFCSICLLSEWVIENGHKSVSFNALTSDFWIGTISLVVFIVSIRTKYPSD